MGLYGRPWGAGFDDGKSRRHKGLPCNALIDAMYGVNGGGINLLYTGSFSGVAEPGAFGLLAIGIAGLAVTRQRLNV